MILLSMCVCGIYVGVCSMCVLLVCVCVCVRSFPGLNLGCWTVELSLRNKSFHPLSHLADPFALLRLNGGKGKRFFHSSCLVLPCCSGPPHGLSPRMRTPYLCLGLSTSKMLNLSFDTLHPSHMLLSQPASHSTFCSSELNNLKVLTNLFHFN